MFDIRVDSLNMEHVNSLFGAICLKLAKKIGSNNIQQPALGKLQNRATIEAVVGASVVRGDCPKGESTEQVGGCEEQSPQ